MDIIFITQRSIPNGGLEALRKAIPCGQEMSEHGKADNDSADYALVWHPPVEMLAGREIPKRCSHSGPVLIIF